MATTDIYERYPAVLSAELADLDLPPEDASVRESMMLAYNATRSRLNKEAALDADWRRAQADAAKLRAGRG